MAEKDRSKLKIISLDGLNQIGKNITVFEYEDDIIVIDCGVSFPDDNMLGVDLVIPDFTYLVQNAKKLRGHTMFSVQFFLSATVCTARFLKCSLIIMNRRKTKWLLLHTA